MKKIDFYFDISSPYSYLAHEQIKRFEKENKIKVNYMPILLGGIHQLANITAPGLNPSRAKHMIKDLKICADWFKVKFQFNRYFPLKTVNIMRGALIAEKEGFLNNYVDQFYKAAWVDSLNLNDGKILERFIKNMNINPKSFIEKLSDQKIKDDLKTKTNIAFKRGVFGAPTFIVGSKMFFGQDRLEFVFREAKK
ncbi:MAG: 2-hydroxychromene-2-carboxylate isomerase [alpha proteobacterium HIMB114]|jgi:2-hydroxychromene-2-carboxylate isomerase|nr:MAG: 2-hydroxychromene-2-carboxylate isomerase [alpha proteobacterium HIMB114]|tara:strand:- start:6603 stop:7187 length:585 start_codon:yes stop_codon:yes gene_type:complete